MAINDKDGTPSRRPPDDERGGSRRHPFGLPLDPYLDWALRTNFRYLGGVPDWVPLLLELRDDDVGRFAHMTWPNGDDGKPWIWVPDLYRSSVPQLAKSRYCMAYINPLLFMETSSDNPLRRMLATEVERYTFGLPHIALQGRASVGFGKTFGVDGPRPLAAAAWSSSAPPKRVVVGVIDDAFAFCNERFRDAQGKSRIKYLWVQDVSVGGLELTASDIDNAVQACRHGGLVDEDEVYRVTGQEDYSSPEHKIVGQHGAHGTHVMDIAAGYDPASAPPDRSIVAVQLPGRIVRDTSGANLAPYVFTAIRYIVDRADALAAKDGSGPLPIVVNLSYGLFAGPHDGSSVLERAIDELVRLRHLSAPGAPLCVVLPAGNNYLWRTHANFVIKHGNKQGLGWRVIPDDRTPSSMEIWLAGVPDGTQSQVKVRVTCPDGTASSWVAEGDAPFEMTTSGGAVICLISFDTAATTGTRPRIVLLLAPTAALNPLDPSEDVAPSGMWNVSLVNFGSDVAFNAWIQRDDTPYGWPILGRQAYFDDPLYRRFDDYGRELESDDLASYVKREGTLNSIATGATTIVLGGCRLSDLAPAKYSAAGPISLPVKGTPTPRSSPGPDAMTISDASVACQGVLAAGTRSNSVLAMNGTSVAAPQATWMIAGMLRAGKQKIAYEVKTVANNEEALHNPPRPTPQRGGAGRIDDQLPRPRVVRWEP